MGINDLQLSPELIATLYPETLVIVSGSQAPVSIYNTPPEVEIISAYPYLGQNGRAICFLVHFPNEEFIAAGDLTFLRKILAACRCSIEDIALINTARNSISLDALIKQFNPELLFIWGSIPGLPAHLNSLTDLEISEIGDLKNIACFEPGTDDP